MSDTQAKATPSKLHQGLVNPRYAVNNSGRVIFELVVMHDPSTDGELLREIVRAVNSHDKLLEALKAIQDLNPFDFQTPIKYSEKVGEMVRAAIQSAEDQPK